MNEEEKITDVEAPTLLDGSPVDKEEAARVHAGLSSGEIKIEMCDGVAEELAAAGLDIEDVKAMLIAATKKTMS
jgi:hypothetical protein